MEAEILEIQELGLSAAEPRTERAPDGALLIFRPFIAGRRTSPVRVPVVPMPAAEVAPTAHDKVRKTVSTFAEYALASALEHLEISRDREAGAEGIVRPAKGFAP